MKYLCREIFRECDRCTYPGRAEIYIPARMRSLPEAPWSSLFPGVSTCPSVVAISYILLARRRLNAYRFGPNWVDFNGVGMRLCCGISGNSRVPFLSHFCPDVGTKWDSVWFSSERQIWDHWGGPNFWDSRPNCLGELGHLGQVKTSLFQF